MSSAFAESASVSWVLDADLSGYFDGAMNHGGDAAPAARRARSAT